MFTALELVTRGAALRGLGSVLSSARTTGAEAERRWSAFSEEIEKISGFTQIERVETLLEPLVDWKDHIARQHVLCAVLMQASQSQCSAQLKRQRLLTAGDRECLLEACLRFVQIPGLLEPLSPKALNLCFGKALARRLGQPQRLVEGAELVMLPRRRLRSVRQQGQEVRPQQLRASA